MKRLLKNKLVLLLVIISFVALLYAGIKEDMYIRKAHNTFENYYAFRGCSKLIKRTATYGICQTTQGQTIKIVLY